MESETENSESLSSMSDDDEVYEVAISPRTFNEEKPKFLRKYVNDIDSLANIYVSADSDYEDRLADRSNDELEDVKILEHKKYRTPKKDYSWRSDRWSPKIQSVCHISPDSPEIKNEIHNLVLVKEDEIKQEEEFLNENDDQDHNRSDFQKSIFAEYPNLKIKDEFNFTSCSIKLEKMDFSHLSNTSMSELDSPTSVNISEEHTPLSTRLSRRGRQLKTVEPVQQVSNKEILSKNKTKKKTVATKSKKTIKPSNSTQRRSSSRLKRNSGALSDNETKNSSSPKPVLKNSDEYKSRKRTKSNSTSKTRRASTSLSEDSDTELSSRTKSKKVRFMEAHGLKDRLEVSKLKTNGSILNSSTPSTKPKKVTFADTNGTTSQKKGKAPADASRKVTFTDTSGATTPTKVKDPISASKKVTLANTNGATTPTKVKDPAATTPPTIVKDPAEDYKQAIATYLLDIDTYKKDLDTWFECLCCDRKFHLLEHCQVHVRGHFPGALTN